MLRLALIATIFSVAQIQAAHADAVKDHVVQIVSDYDNLRMYFKPKMIVVQPGDTVTWVNVVAEDHNIVSYPDGYPKGAAPLSSPYLKNKGETWSRTFTTKGTFEYHCIPHLPMGMHGTVIVSRPSEQGEFHVPNVAEMQKYAQRLREFFDEEEFKYKPRNMRHSKADASGHAHKH